MWNARLDDSQTGIKTSRRNINNLKYAEMIPQIWYHLNGRKWRGTKEPLDESERREWKSWFDIQHYKNSDHHILYHHVIVNRRGKSGSYDRFIFLAFKITVGGDHEIKRYLLPGRKAVTKLDSILESRDITLPTKVHLAKCQLLSHVQCFETPWTLAPQAALSMGFSRQEH